MSAHNDGKVRERSQEIIDTIEQYEQLKTDLATARVSGDMEAYARLKREIAFMRRILAKLTKEI